jgi:hypothetical protein
LGARLQVAARPSTTSESSGSKHMVPKRPAGLSRLRDGLMDAMWKSARWRRRIGGRHGERDWLLSFVRTHLDLPNSSRREANKRQNLIAEYHANQTSFEGPRTRFLRDDSRDRRVGDVNECSRGMCGCRSFRARRKQGNLRPALRFSSQSGDLYIRVDLSGAIYQHL